MLLHFSKFQTVLSCNIRVMIGRLFCIIFWLYCLGIPILFFPIENHGGLFAKDFISGADSEGDLCLLSGSSILWLLINSYKLILSQNGIQQWSRWNSTVVGCWTWGTGNCECCEKWYCNWSSFIISACFRHDVISFFVHFVFSLKKSFTESAKAHT